MTALPLVKYCECCEGEFRRPTGSSRISDQTWENRRFCSASCGLQKAGQSINYETPGAPACFDRYQQAAILSSNALRERMFDFYLRTAAKRGLPDVWQAAVMLGMAA
jgi:hypothetical protein